MQRKKDISMSDTSFGSDLNEVDAQRSNDQMKKLADSAPESNSILLQRDSMTQFHWLRTDRDQLLSVRLSRRATSVCSQNLKYQPKGLVLDDFL